MIMFVYSTLEKEMENDQSKINPLHTDINYDNNFLQYYEAPHLSY